MKKRNEESREQIRGAFWDRILKNIFFRKMILILGLVLAVSIFGSVFTKKVLIPNIFENKEGKVTTISKSSLQEILEQGEFSALKNYYNSYATVFDEDGETVKYYVSYEGTIRIGIDVEKIETVADSKEKKIIISLPKAEIQDIDVKFDTMEFIFMGNSYETENVTEEAFRACNEDLKKKAEKSEPLLTQAQENIENAVMAFAEPLKEQMPNGYAIVFQEEGKKR